MPKKIKAENEQNQQPSLLDSPSKSSSTSPRRRRTSNNETTTTTTTTTTTNLLSSLLQRKKKAPTYKAHFPVPGIAHQQKGGYYSQPEVKEGNVVGCPNVGNELHCCTSYCYHHYAKLTKRERLMQHARSSMGDGGGASTTGAAAYPFASRGSQACVIT